MTKFSAMPLIAAALFIIATMLPAIAGTDVHATRRAHAAVTNVTPTGGGGPIRKPPCRNWHKICHPY
jgi:hypothetical protein